VPDKSTELVRLVESGQSIAAAARSLYGRPQRPQPPRLTAETGVHTPLLASDFESEGPQVCWQELPQTGTRDAPGYTNAIWQRSGLVALAIQIRRFGSHMSEKSASRTSGSPAGPKLVP
jgi:hypothetical protein